MSKINYRDNERGGTGVKLTFVLFMLFLAAHAGYNYIPVAYAAESFKSDMYTAVVQGLAVPNRAISPIDAVKERVQRAARAHEIPEDAVVEIKQVKKSVQAHVIYDQPVNILPLGLYTYNYHFDHTATPTGFLLKE